MGRYSGTAENLTKPSLGFGKRSAILFEVKADPDSGI
jgi:hypothetical protein